MSMHDDAVWERLQARFRERLARELPLLREHQLSATPFALDEARATLVRLAHGLSGAAGTFGFPDVSVAAANLEERLRRDSDALAVEAALSVLIDAMTHAIPDQA